MARPIKTTPVLTGKNSAHFNRTLTSNLNNKVSREDRERILKTVTLVTKQTQQ